MQKIGSIKQRCIRYFNFFSFLQVRVLFRKELDKVYDPNEPVDDMREREEEMERMREHVFKGKIHELNSNSEILAL